MDEKKEEIRREKVREEENNTYAQDSLIKC